MALGGTTSELARYLNITQKQLRYLEQLGVLKKVSHNRWDVTKCAAAYIRHLQDNNGKSRLEQYREQHMKAKAEIAEIEAMERKKQVAFVDDIHEEYEDMVLKLRAKLLLIPRQMSAMAVPGDQRGREILWRRALNDALKEISNDGAVKQKRNRRKSGNDSEAA